MSKSQADLEAVGRSVRLHREVSAVVGVGPDAAFEAITGVDHLAEWNERMTRVVSCPEKLTSGVEWVVEFKDFGWKWLSRSRVKELDPERRVFHYRTQTDDGNPSFAAWRWHVEPAGEGSRITVSWSLHPATFWRRILLARIRHYQLAREVVASLAALPQSCVPGS